MSSWRYPYYALGAALFAAAVSLQATASTRFDPAALRAWADEELGTAVAEKRLSGAAFGLVEDGKVVFLNAYGWEDPIAETPLDPQRSRMRMCSLSKSFTAVSALQLVERGRFPGLDAPACQRIAWFKS